MCGRFTLTTDLQAVAETIAGRLKTSRPRDRLGMTSWEQPRYNICPSQPVVVVLNDGKREISQARWGLIPAWARDSALGNKLANARAEGIEAKPSFRNPFRRRRCLVWADGFYEWKPTKPKVPYYFRLKTREVFAFAGLWDVWREPTGADIVTCCLITTTPNRLLATVHNRMPVILPPQFDDLWLAEAPPPVEELLKVLRPYPAEAMEGFPVSTLVNIPQHDEPACIAPVPTLL
jgi:putative SOS response-associated peptidase YedK